jgi:tRNA A-37 threonylcarbamoyl transferase component Bud32
MAYHPTDHKLRQFQDDQLDPTEAEAIAAHVDSCPECQKTLDQLTPFGDDAAAEPSTNGAAGYTSESAAPPAAQWPTVEGYEILEVLGRGGMGVVYKARQVKAGRPVALKVILAGPHAGPDDLARFRTEATAAAQVAHPGIVTVYEVGEQDGLPFFSLEYCPGGSLKQKLDGKPLPPRPAAELVAALAEALHEAHRQGIVHRDLKPANVLFTADGRPKVADFGLAKKVSEPGLTASNAVVGTPSYMAPEQVPTNQGRREPVGPAADVYALGAVLYECLTGRPPFAATTPVDTLLLVLTEEPASPRRLLPSVPRDLETICLKCLRKEPTKRYASARELADDLRRFLHGEPIRARPTPLWERGWRWCRNNPWKAGFGGVAAVALVLLGLYLRGEQLAERQRREHAEQVLQAQQEVAYREGVALARAAAARGDWRTALELYERLITGAYCPDRQHLEVERLPGFLAVNDRDRFAQEVTRLTARDDLGPDAARVKLLLGEFYLCQPARQEEARRLIDEALAAPGQLSDEDRAYAQALTTRNSNRLITLLQGAIARAPFHHRANRAYLMAHVLRGEFPEARAQAVFMRMHFPDDPLTDYAEALLTVLEGDRAAGLAKLAPLDQKLGSEPRARIEQYLNKLADLLDKPEGSGLFGQAQALRDLTRPGLEPLTFSVPTAALVIQTLEQIAQNAKALRAIDLPALREKDLQAIREAVPRLAAASRESPEAWFLCMRGVLHVHLARPLLNAGRMTEARGELQTALDLFQQATTAPTLLPRSPTRYQARAMALVADVCLLRGAVEPTPVQEQRLRENCTRLTTEGRAWPHLRRDAAGLIFVMLTVEQTPKQIEEWQLDQPANRKRYEARVQFLYEFGRRLFADWQFDEPKNPAPFLLLAKLELKAGNLEAALRAARQVTTLSPGHKEGLELEHQALKGLRERYKE